MKYLLDTNIWLWSIGTVERISTQGREILENGREEIYLSAASSMEITIKVQLGKLRLPSRPGQCMAHYMEKQRITSLPVTHAHAMKVFDLPIHHRDPFDRLIVAQAMLENMTILTSDLMLEKYPAKVMFCGF